MAIQKLAIGDFLLQAGKHTIIDVRSPAEYAHAHIPGAYSLPLFSDEERKVVGTAYKQQSREDAIKIGLDYFGVKMRQMVEEVERLAPHDKTVLIHCWRGGMRSAGVAWLLDLYGFKVYTLMGGYKAYRNWALQQFNEIYQFRILGGYTGSGKTEILQQLGKSGQYIIDLEGIASHRGSAFGAIEGVAQPSQEMFENKLALELSAQKNNVIWLEDESQRIGLVNIPHGVWNQMRASHVSFVDIPFDARLQHIAKGYGKKDKEKLINSIMRIKKRLGGLETKTAINCLIEDDIIGSFAVLLKYYDKQYNKALAERPPGLIHKISCEKVDDTNNTKLLTSQPATT